MTLDINDYAALTYVRKPYEVLAIEVTNDNIKELAPFIGELDHKNGTPFIKSQKSLVGSTFRVWPGFFVTVLNGKLRCYSRRMFFNQFAEMTPDVKLATNYVLGDRSNPAYRVEPPKPKEPVEPSGFRKALEERGAIKSIMAPAEAPYVPHNPLKVKEESRSEDLLLAPPIELPATLAPTCEHGFALDTECPYKKCAGAPEEDVDSNDDTGTDEQGNLVGGSFDRLKNLWADTPEPAVIEEGDFFGAVEPEPVVTDPEPVTTEPAEKPLAQQLDEMMNRGTSETYITDQD